MKFDAVIFDLDGTLLNTIDDIADAINAILASMGLPGHKVEAYKKYVGAGMESLVRNVLPEKCWDEVTIKAFKELEVGYRGFHKSRPYDGINELLSGISSLDIRMGILSNRPEASVKLLVGKLLGGFHFDAILGAVDGLPLKPHQAPALEISRRLSVSPNRCLFLGDSDVDMQSASSAGMYPVGALWGFRTADELVSNGAETIINSPGELLKILKPIPSPL
ncbi:MAG: HAD family hydrolase [Pseudomonadota bacterium]